ncbi:MAG: hypothetical protein AAB617_02730 [Patescibacteria group bacterium]
MNGWLNQFRDFVSEEERQYRYRIGKLLASSLSGFVAGVIFTSIIVALGFVYYTATR